MRLEFGGLGPLSPVVCVTEQKAFSLGVCLLAMICAAVPGLAKQPLPPYLTFPAQVSVNADSVNAEDYGEAEFTVPGQPDPVVQKGRHWYAKIAKPPPERRCTADPRSIWPL